VRSITTIAGFAAAAAAIAALETLFRGSAGASVIMTIAFWKAVSEGSIALAAVGELTGAKWVAPVKRPLISFYPMIPLTALLMLLLAARFDLYSWTGSEGVWLNKWFFLARNVGASVALFVLAWRLAAGRQGPGRGATVVGYLLVFVLSHTLLAFDLVMSLEHPWISTLFGGYFFIEALYTGMAVAGILCFALTRSPAPEARAALSRTVHDVATLIFGFSLLWAGLFYAQFLVIWYGNIPEEAGYLVRRLSEPPIRELSYSVLAALFFAPFLMLLSRRAKSRPAVVAAASLIVLYGVFAERIVFIAPAAHLNPMLVAAESLVMLIYALALVRRHGPLPPASR
jgi:hypothetical protein